MNYWLLISLCAASGLMMILELRGVPVVLQLPFKGDIKRESQFLAQFGQAVATVIAAALIYSFEPTQPRKAIAVAATVIAASLICNGLKKIFGRVRPNRENAGKFLGPMLKVNNKHESFPSSHSACAMALATSLTILYPQAGVVFWSLGIITSVLRYLMDAHWPSDVLTGIALGYALGWAGMRIAGFTG